MKPQVSIFHVPDPYRQGRLAFERALALIERGLDEIETVFWDGTT